jgi:hypothetical protein
MSDPPTGTAPAGKPRPVDAADGSSERSDPRAGPEQPLPAFPSCAVSAQVEAHLVEALAAQHCEDYLAAAQCLPPVRTFPDHSGPRRMQHAADHFLASCQLPAGSTVLDCNESPCLLLVDRQIIETGGHDCEMVHTMRDRLGRLPEGLPADERVWESTFMVHPHDRDEADEARATHRMDARFRHALDWLQGHEADGVTPLPPSCDSLERLMDAWYLGDVDAICMAALEHWGCEAPDFVALARQESAARRRAAELLDPRCASVAPTEALLSCELPPCTLTVPDDGSPAAGLCGGAALPLWVDPDDDARVPVVTIPLLDTADAFEDQAPFRVRASGRAFRGR